MRDQLAAFDSQPWGFIPLEIGIVSAEEQGFQAVSIRDYRARNPLPFDLKELSQSVDRGYNLTVNQRVVFCQLGIAFPGLPEGPELLDGIPAFIRESILKIQPPVLDFC